jgi:hypothetical protein
MATTEVPTNPMTPEQIAIQREIYVLKHRTDGFPSTWAALDAARQREYDLETALGWVRERMTQ